jgi:hypothetical protein
MHAIPLDRKNNEVPGFPSRFDSIEVRGALTEQHKQCETTLMPMAFTSLLRCVLCEDSPIVVGTVREVVTEIVDNLGGASDRLLDRPFLPTHKHSPISRPVFLAFDALDSRRI